MIALLSLAFAGPDPSWEQALRAELERTGALSLPEAPAIYDVRFHLAVLEQHDLRTSFGSVLREDNSPFHGLGIELRVGDPSYDNTGFGGWENGFARIGLASELSADEVRQRAWLLTDRAYKEAVEQYARKRSQFTAPDTYPGDYTLLPAVQADDGWATLADPTPVREIAVAMSEAFVKAGSDLLVGDVFVGQEAGGVLLLGSDGTKLTKPLSEVSIRVVAHARAEDGQLLTDSRLWSVRSPAKLPGPEAMVTEVEAMAKALVARTEAKRLPEEYVGPVLFEGDAARQLFRYLLVPQIEGTPPEIPYDSWFGDLGDARDPVRVGRRVLPEGWAAFDDPTAHPEHPSFHVHDWEATPARRVDLVEDGIVRDLLMSRVPRKGLEPNGHGRAFLGSRALGRASQLTVVPRKSASTRKLLKKGLKMATAYGRDHVLVVRRLQADPARALDETVFGEDSDGLRLPPPVEVVRVWADGREEVLRGARFASVQRYILRDIALAGPTTVGTFLAPASGGDTLSLGPTEGLPTRIEVPDILVREIELVPKTGDPRDNAVLDPPSE